jgi:Mg-chelatase subunit ChlD
MRGYEPIVVLLAGVVVCAIACSSKPSESGAQSSQPPPGAEEGPGSGLGNGGSGPGGDLGGDFGAGSSRGTSDAGLTADAACGAIVLEPEAVETEETIERKIQCTADAPSPVALYIVLDNSGSMDDSNKWEQAVDAISEFVRTEPASGTAWSCIDQDGDSVPPPDDLPPPGAGAIRVAIQYFHLESGGRNSDECDGSGHDTPAVSMGPLPDNGAAIVSSLNGTGPSGNTPTVGALTGGTEFCAGFQGSNPDEQCVVVVVTDGQPNGCGLSSDCGGGGGRGGGDCVDPNAADVLTPIASAAFRGDGVLTFTVGMDGVTTEGFDLLDAIAAAGGSDCSPGSPGNEACAVSRGRGPSLLDALHPIREPVQVTQAIDESITTTETLSSTLPCQWEIPTPSAGRTFDKDLVNVTITTSGSPTRLGNVPSQNECEAADGGWYYDDGDSPTRIVACPATCDVIENLIEARVEVLVGCATEPALFQ